MTEEELKEEEEALALPQGIPGEVAEIVLELATKILKTRPWTGGSKAFYSPREWTRRGYRSGLSSLLIIAHDGNEFADLCDWSRQYYPLMEEFQQELQKHGVYVEQGECWYSYILPDEGASKRWKEYCI